MSHPVQRVFALHTSTHTPAESSSAALTRAGIDTLARMYPHMEVRWLNANDLHIVQNLSCYANGKKNCADPASGPYRCWASHLSQKEPEKYGGRDEMWMIYDNLAWCDTFIFSTSTRWGSQSALAQKVIERMNTLENRAVSYGEPYPLHGKRLGIVVTGLHWHTGKVGTHLLETLRWFGFATQPDDSTVLAWQRSKDPFFEHPDNDMPYAEKWEDSRQGQDALRKWATAVATSTTTFV